MEIEDFPRGREPDGDRRDAKPSNSRQAKQRRKRGGCHAKPRSSEIESFSFSQTYIDPHSDKFRVPGVKSMGMVTEVSETHLRVSLPHGVEESVEAKEASDVLCTLLAEESNTAEAALLRKLHGKPSHLTELFAPGQYIHGTYVLDEQDEMRFSLKLCHFYNTITVSKLPEGAFLTGCVRTEEDHGYMLTFGVKGVSGFLKKTDLVQYYGTEASLLPGQLLDCVVQSPSVRGVIQLSVNPESMRESMTVEGGAIDPQFVLPGALIHAQITHVIDSGILLKVMNTFKGFISLFHLAEGDVVEGWKAEYLNGQMVKARVLSWNPTRSEYILSMKPFLVKRELPRMPAIIGQVFADAVVQRADPVGLSLKLPTQPIATLSYVFQENLGDLPLQSSDFKLRQCVATRLTGFHAMEGLVVGSLKESVIRSGIVCFDDLYPGRVAEGSIVRIYDDHVYVSVGEGIEGCARQCGFSPNVSLRRIFNPGQLVSYRVLRLKPEIRQVVISLDAQLVHASLPFLTGWDDAEVGMRVIGYVLAIKRTVVIISFAGDVHGVLPQDNVKLGPEESLANCFHKNQVIKAWIKSCHHRSRRITLTTLKQQLEQKPAERKAQQHPFMALCKAPNSLAIGDTADATVEKVLNQGMGFLVHYRVHESLLEGKAILPLLHLSDHRLSQQQLQKCLKEESSIGEVVVLKTAEYVQVSRKATLVKNASMLPRRLEDVKENMLLNGYVSFVGEEFLTVSFLGDVSGRVFKNQTPQPGLSPHEQFFMGQSVLTRAVKVDVDRQRIYLTLNPSRTAPSDAVFMEDAFLDLTLCRSLIASPPQISRDRIGELVEVTVQSMEKDKAHVIIADQNFKGVIPSHHFDDGPPDVTEKRIRACVVDVTLEGLSVLSLRPCLIEKGFKPAKKAKKRKEDKAELQKSSAAVIEWITEFYLTVSIPEEDHALAAVSTSDYNLQCFPLSKAFQLGQQITAEKQKKGKTPAGCPIMSTQLAPLLWHRDVRREISGSQTSLHNSSAPEESPLHAGDMAEGCIEQVKEGGVRVKLDIDASSHSHASVSFADVFDHFTDHLPSCLQPGVQVKGVVQKSTDKGITLSLRASEGGCVEAEVPFLEAECPKQLEKGAIERGSQLYGYVSGYGKNTPCLFINIAREMFATVYHPHFADEPLTDLPQHFPIGKLVKGTVVSSNYPKVGLSLRSGNKPLDRVGSVRKGTVANILPQGIYVALDGTGMQGLVPRYDLQPHQSKSFKKGQVVEVKVSPVTDAFHLVLSIADGDHGDADMEVEEEQMEEMEVEEISDADFEQTLSAAVKAERQQMKETLSRTTETKEPHPSLAKKRRQLIWGDISPEGTPHKTEPAVPAVPVFPEVKHETPGDRANDPKTDDDFERLLFSNPNSSYLWVRYMASFLERGNISKARATAERALETISFREEKTRLEIWLAYLNLERTHGGTTESIMTLFQRAILCNDPKKLHLAFLKILEASQQTEIGDLVLKSMQRRCPSSAKVYLQEFHYWLSTNRGGHCKRTLDTALKNLPKRKHVKVIVQAGILEFKLGKVERGRDLFEGLLSLYTKRMDLWNVYLDQELLQQDKEHARALFERVSSIDGGRKRMKWIFKRYLQFEMQHGTAKTVEQVKEKAKAYVSKKNDELKS